MMFLLLEYRHHTYCCLLCSSYKEMEQSTQALPFSRCTSAYSPALTMIQDLAPYLSVEERKAFITMFRAQTKPTENDFNLASRLTSIIPKYDKIIDPLTPLFETPLLTGLLINIILASPLSETSISDERAKSIAKETQVMESMASPSTLHYPSIFCEELHHIPLSTKTPSNPNMCAHIKTSIDRWIQKVSRRPLYPHLTTKGVSTYTSTLLKQMSPEFAEKEIINGTDLEMYYAKTAEWVSGPSEMRQKWYPSGVTPRTYYAAGGDAYGVSSKRNLVLTILPRLVVTSEIPSTCLPISSNQLNVIPVLIVFGFVLRLMQNTSSSTISHRSPRISMSNAISLIGSLGTAVVR